MAAQTVDTPNFFDQQQRLTQPDLSGRERVLFATTTDYAPFNFLDRDGRLTGFNVDLARAICETLGILPRCRIQARPFEELAPMLEAGEADAVIAGVALTAQNRQRFAFSEPYFRYPARFVTRREDALSEPIADAIGGRSVAVLAGSAHAAMLQAFFPTARMRTFDDREAALAAMKDGTVDAFFGDGVAMAYWLGSDSADGCCTFSGGPYLSDRFLGEGLAVAVARDDARLAGAIDYALGEIIESGTFTELLLRYFPVSAF